MKQAKRTRNKIASRTATLQLIDGTIAERYRKDAALPDGNANAIRLLLTEDGTPAHDTKGRQQYVCPWLLSGTL